MGAISMVKEHNTNGGRLMESQILIYWFLQFNNKIKPFFFSKSINLQKKKNIPCCVQPAH